MYKKNILRNISFLCLTIFLMGCNSGKKTAKVSNDLLLISKGSLHGAGEEGISAQETIIASESEWNALKEKMNVVNPVSENFQNDEIDFSKEVVIAVFETVKTTGGHAVFIAEISETNSEIHIKLTRTAPEGMTTSVMEQPYYLAKMKKPSKPVVFE